MELFFVGREIKLQCLKTVFQLLLVFYHLLQVILWFLIVFAQLLVARLKNWLRIDLIRFVVAYTLAKIHFLPHTITSWLREIRLHRKPHALSFTGAWLGHFGRQNRIWNGWRTRRHHSWICLLNIYVRVENTNIYSLRSLSALVWLFWSNTAHWNSFYTPVHQAALTGLSVRIPHGENLIGEPVVFVLL